MRSNPLIIMVALLFQLNLIGAIGTASDDASAGDSVAAVDRISTAATGTEGLYGGIVSYEDVALIVNNNSAQSKEIGTYFAERRGIPAERIINITAPNQETINPTQFDDLANQVSDTLRDRGLTDSINYMVTTTGVPLRVSGNNWRMASVDEELMLIDGPYESEVHGNYWIENPYYDSWKPFSREQYGIRLVTRLTGYTVEEAKRLVDLSDASLGVRGRALLDMDPGKGYQPSGYGMGNYWMIGAHDWLTDHGYESLLDDNNTFRTDWTNTSAYFSWGSNDGDWGKWLLSNSDFERGTGDVPAGWTGYSVNGFVGRTQESVDSGSYSLKMNKTGQGLLIAEQSYDLAYMDHRYIFDGRANLASVASGQARAFVEGFDGNGAKVYYKEFYNRTGTRAWEGFQGVVENRTDMVRLRIVLQLTGTGAVYWDNVALRVIRPHNQWVPGAIAETCVSTGGRSMTYGTWYGQSLVADLVRDGVTGVKGYVYEPFLSAMAHADILFPSYYSGYSLAEAFWMGSELGSWMGVVIGDPKCTPYANERADMGFGPAPLSPGVDGKGEPLLTLSLFNRGGSDVTGGLVEFVMDNITQDSRKVTIPSGKYLNISYSYDDMPQDIQGSHVFSVVLNSDAAIWEYDSSNDRWDGPLVVNTMPSISLDVQQGTVVTRTHGALFNITLLDGDLDLPELGPHVEVLDPNDVPMDIELVSKDPLSGGMVFRYGISFPFDSLLGVYDISTDYTDPAGSPTSDSIKAAFRLINAAPSLQGSFGSETARRGTEMVIDLSWSDEDTPDGDLDVTAVVAGVGGVRLDVGPQERTSNWSCTYRVQIPPEHGSQTWQVTATAEDRNAAKASWSATFRTWNGGPSISVESGVPGNYTQLDIIPLTFNYTDPEGIEPDEMIVEVVEQVTPEIGTVLFTQNVVPASGVPFSMGISCRNLPLGSLDLRISCRDDEGEAFSIAFPGAITIVNIPADVTVHSLLFRSDPGDPGDPLLRGDILTVTVVVDDPDDSGMGAVVKGKVMRGSEEVYSMDLDWKGAKLYSGKVITARDWQVGAHSIGIEVADDANQLTYLDIPLAFVLTADNPNLESGSLKVDQWGNMNVTVAMVMGDGQCWPLHVALVVTGADGAVGPFNLTSSSSGLVWSFSGVAPSGIVNSSLIVIDDIGRVSYFNGSLSIDVDPPYVEPRVDDGSATDPMLLIVIGVLIVMAVLLIAIILLLVLRPRGSDLKPAPMNAFPGMAPNPIQGSLPGGAPGALPAPAFPRLPPSAELMDGSIYHAPSGKVPLQSPPPRQSPAQIIPEPPEPAGIPAPPVPPKLGEGLNTTEIIEPPGKHVQHTDNNDIPGDPGQSVPPVI